MILLIYIGVALCLVGLVFTWRSGGISAFMESDHKSVRYRITIGLTIGILVLLLTSSFVADRELAQAKEEYARLHPEEAVLKEARAKLAETDALLAAKKVELKNWEAVLATKMKDEPVPSGKSRLCYVVPNDFESEKYTATRMFLKHLSEMKVQKGEEVRGAEKVAVWSNLDGAYARSWLPLFEKEKIKAWVE